MDAAKQALLTDTAVSIMDLYFNGGSVNVSKASFTTCFLVNQGLTFLELLPELVRFSTEEFSRQFYDQGTPEENVAGFIEWVVKIFNS